MERERERKRVSFGDGHEVWWRKFKFAFGWLPLVNVWGLILYSLFSFSILLTVTVVFVCALQQTPRDVARPYSNQLLSSLLPFINDNYSFIN